MCPLWTEDINTAVIRRRWYTDITEVWFISPVTLHRTFAHNRANAAGWWHGAMVTHLIRSAKLLYAGPA